MDYEDSTVSIFSQNAPDYEARQTSGFQDKERKLFMSKIKKAGKVMDLGSGPGHDALIFKQNGFDVLAVDGAQGMIDLAINRGLRGMVLKYSELNNLKEKFDGIWASYSLLHIPKQEIRKVLKTVRKLLNKGGVLYASFREGEGEEMRLDDRYSGGRFFAYYNKKEIKDSFGKVFDNIHLGLVENAGPKGGIYALVIIN